MLKTTKPILYFWKQHISWKNPTTTRQYYHNNFFGRNFLEKILDRTKYFRDPQIIFFVETFPIISLRAKTTKQNTIVTSY